MFIVQPLVMLRLARIIGGFQVIIKATEVRVTYALRGCNHEYCKGFIFELSSPTSYALGRNIEKLFVDDNINL